MKQILAIFAKDARRFWPEILVCCAMLVVLVLVYPIGWRTTNALGAVSGGRLAFGAAGGSLLAATLVFLVPVGWLVLIARAVHCERLVGDTQFWLTRPYDWRKLFAAKLLFFAAFLYAPFFLAQCLLLLEAGLHPLHYLGGMLFNLLLLTAVGVLPLLALSSLTSGFGRLMLVLLGLGLVFVAMIGGVSAMPFNVVTNVPDLVSGELVLGALFWGSLPAALILYARRNAKAGWLIVGSVLVVIGATAFFNPDRALVGSFYPELSAGSEAPVTFAYGAKDLNQPTANLTVNKRWVEVVIPMTESGVQDGSVAVPRAVRVTLTGAGGSTWESPWQGYIATPFIPGQSNTVIRFLMPRSAYDQLKGAPMTLHITIALTMGRKASQSLIALPTGDFAVPEIGVCKPEPWMWQPDEFWGIACRSPMNQPELTYVTVPWSSKTCKAGAEADQDQAIAKAWVGELDREPAELGISPVSNVPLVFSQPWLSKDWEEAGHHWSICPGAPVQFTQYQAASRLREDVSIPGFHLPELAFGDRFLMGGTE